MAAASDRCYMMQTWWGSAMPWSCKKQLDEGLSGCACLRVLMSSSQLGHRKPSVLNALWDRCIGGSGPFGWPSRDPLELHSLSSSLLLSLLRRLEAQVLIDAAAEASAKGLTWGCFLGGVRWVAAGGTAAGGGVSQGGEGLPLSASSGVSGPRPRLSRASRLEPVDHQRERRGPEPRYRPGPSTTQTSIV